MKKELLLLIIQTCPLYSSLSNQQKPLIISLGFSCEPALMARTFNIRHAAFPLDWLGSYEFEKVCLAIQEHFAHFLDRKYLTYNTVYIKNEYYNFAFFHDFPNIGLTNISQEYENNGTIVPDFLTYLEKIQAKYEVRINRFYETLNGPNPIYFFRTHISPKEAQIFIHLISLLYPNLIYKLIVTNYKNEHEFDWNKPQVINFWPIERNPIYKNIWFSVEEWRNIFIKLGLITKSMIFNTSIEELCVNHMPA